MRAMLNLHREPLIELLGDAQYGMGQRAATEKMFRLVEAAVHEHGDNVAVALDVTNAFNTMSRHHMMEEVAQDDPALLPTASIVLARAQRHYFYDDEGHAHQVVATSGVDQGDPLSAALFMLGMRKPMTALQRRMNLDYKLRHAAYMDDSLLVTRACGLPDLFNIAQEELGRMGLQLNRTKTKLWQPPLDQCLNLAGGE